MGPACSIVICLFADAVDYKTFLTILNRPDGFKPAGTPGTRIVFMYPPVPTRNPCPILASFISASCHTLCVRN